MCLYSRQRRPKLSRKEIVCYKILKTKDDGTFTPFRRMFITDGQLYNKIPVRASEKIKKSFIGSYYLYDVGLIHSYLDLEEAKSRIRSSPACGFFIYKCHIPKYTRHVYGIGKEIAAKKIIIDEKIIIDIDKIIKQ